MNTESSELRFAVKVYSRVLRRAIWVVLNYPCDQCSEQKYITAKKELGLRKTRRSMSQVWPPAFTPPDGSPLYDVHAARLCCTPE